MELKPPKNLRLVIVRCCDTCKSGSYDDGSFICARPDGPVWSAGDKTELVYVCDYWSVFPGIAEYVKNRQ